MANLEVRELAFYPIKGAAASYPEEVTFTEQGIAYDRHWVVCNPDGSFMSQKKEPELALVWPRIEGDTLIVTAPSMETLKLDVNTTGEEEPINIYKKVGTGYFQGEQASEWLTDFLKKPANLYRVAQSRTVKPECQVEGATTEVGFADGFPLLLLSQASLRELNQHLEEPVVIDRFRGNIVVDGEELDPYAEDFWREIRIGDMTFFVVRACARCPVPDTDQLTGIRKPERAVTGALRATRHGIDPVSNTPGNFFGQNVLQVYKPGAKIRVGDEVVVRTAQDKRNFIPEK